MKMLKTNTKCTVFVNPFQRALLPFLCLKTKIQLHKSAPRLLSKLGN